MYFVIYPKVKQRRICTICLVHGREIEIGENERARRHKSKKFGVWSTTEQTSPRHPKLFWHLGMELAFSSLRFSSHQDNNAFRYRKLSAPSSCNAANLVVKSSNSLSSSVGLHKNFSKTLLYRNYYRHSSIRVCLQNWDYFKIFISKQPVTRESLTAFI